MAITTFGLYSSITTYEKSIEKIAGEEEASTESIRKGDKSKKAHKVCPSSGHPEDGATILKDTINYKA